jgi:hypothetical protein
MSEALDRARKQLANARKKARAAKKAAEAPAAAAYTAAGVATGGALGGVLQSELPDIIGIDSRIAAGLILVSIAAASRGPSASLVSNLGSGLLAGWAQDQAFGALND